MVYILFVQFFAEQLNCLSKSLEVYYLALPQEFDYIVDIRIITEPENIIIGYSCFLLWCDHP